MSVIEHHIKMLPVQREFYRAKEDFVAIVSSRSCGKSWIATFCALVDMLNGKNVLYMAQTDGAFYKGPWEHLQNFLYKYNLMDYWSWNSTYKTGRLGKSRFYFASYENEKAARGATECSSLYLDEFMLSKPNILAITAPCLRGHDNLGNIIVPKIRATGTPDMTSMWQLMVVEHEKYGIRLLRAKLSDMPDDMVSPETKALLEKSIFDEKLRRQEIEGEIIIGEDATSLITLADFPAQPQLFTDQHIYAGLDMAHTGLRDAHCFAAIKGNALLAFHEFGNETSEDVAHYIRKFQNSVGKIHKLNMDLAWSESVYDQLKYEIPCTQVAFAERPPDEYSIRQYGNIRAYGYFKLAEMHKNGLCVDLQSPWIDSGIVPEYKREITNTHFVIDRLGRLLIEPKEDIKMRVGRSPDPADSLMLACLDRATREDPLLRSNSGMRQSDVDKILEDV